MLTSGVNRVKIKLAVLALAPAVAALLLSPARAEVPIGLERIRASTVKVVNTVQRPNYDSPWRRHGVGRVVGSGVIIPGNRILTSAHTVSDSRFLKVEKEASDIPYPARVAYVAHDCDLALLEVLDEGFFDDTSYLPFSHELPELGDTVEAYGFPRGGRRISVTRGIVSRIDYSRYSHPGEDFHLIVQIDAALNPGNSGGPVLKDGRIIGIAFQAIPTAENIGYVIPMTVVGRFLADIADGVYDGYPELGLAHFNLLNPAQRARLGLRPERTGVIVSDVLQGFSAAGAIEPGDILLEIDGLPIRNDGTIVIGGHAYLLEEVVERKLVGEMVDFRIIREGREKTAAVKLKPLVETMARRNQYDRLPEYFVFAGLVFTPLSRDYLRTWDRWWDRAKKSLLYYFDYYYTDRLYLERPQVVVMTRVLPSPVNRYYIGLTDEIVTKVNGRSIADISDLVEAFENNESDYHVIEFDGDPPPVILPAAEAAREHGSILLRYGIARDRHIAPAVRPGETE